MSINKDFIHRKYLLCLISKLLLSFFASQTLVFASENKSIYYKIEPKNFNNSRWIGNKKISKPISILILAGHADSQGIDGAGTSGEAVDLRGFKPMSTEMTDELFWNLKVCKSIVKIGKKKGLNISFYDPKERTIIDPNNEKTNWSVGAQHSLKGGYSLEIHFDSYGEYGFGSGLIPPVSSDLNYIDESLARDFGRYPLFFRGGLGAPRRDIRVLEIGKLEGSLEANLRDKRTRNKTIEAIASKVIDSILIGLEQKSSFNPKLQKGYIFLPTSYPTTTLEAS